MSDPLANAYNVLGAQGMVGPNPYLEFTGQIPLAGYAGVPTNAQGQPIASYQQWLASQQGQQAPGTTLNSAPASSGISPNQANLNAQLAAVYAGGGQSGGGFGGQGSGGSFGNGVYLENLLQQGAGSYGPGTQAQQAAPAAPTQSSNPAAQRQAYLQALANPGPVPTYGAQMLPGAQATGAPQPSVLAQFLAAHPQGGTTGAGGYTNAPFFGTLKNLQAAGAS